MAKKTTAKSAAKKTTPKVTGTSRFPYSMDDLQEKTGMRANTFRVWKAKNNKRIKRGLKNFEIENPNNPNRKLFSKQYLERILKLRQEVRTPVTSVTAKVRPGSYVVAVRPNQLEAFNAIASQFHWRFKKV